MLGDFAGAQEIVQNMAEPESRIWPLWNITSMMSEAGRADEALALAENQDSAYLKAYAPLQHRTRPLYMSGSHHHSELAAVRPESAGALRLETSQLTIFWTFSE
jgi:hypothetical protein